MPLQKPFGFIGEGGQSFLQKFSGAEAAYSVYRKLNSDYTGLAFTVNNGFTSYDVNFDEDGNAETGSAATFFATSSNVYVTTWYDQSGNGNNATFNTSGNAPHWKRSGGLLGNGSAFDFDADDFLDTDSSLSISPKATGYVDFSSNSNTDAQTVIKITNAPATQYVRFSYLGAGKYYEFWPNNTTQLLSTGTWSQGALLPNRYVVSYDGTTANFFNNGTNEGTDTGSASQFTGNATRIGYELREGNNRGMDGSCREIVWWPKYFKNSAITAMYYELNK